MRGGRWVRGQDSRMRIMPSGRLALLQLTWRHLKYERASSSGVALAVLLTLLPAGSLLVESSDPHVSLTVELMAAALVPLLVLLVGVSGRWYIEIRLHDLALLRARG